MRFWISAGLLFAVAWFGLFGGAAQDQPPSGGVKPLSLDGLLDETLPTAPAPGKAVKVDNGSCYVCHRNYEEEKLVQTHAQEKVGCVDCHGESVDHRNDENNTIPPDKMYPLGKVDAMCGECHVTHDAPAAQVIARWQERCPQKTKEIVCTDCHFQHRLALRIVRWDKQTRQLLTRPADSGRPRS